MCGARGGVGGERTDVTGAVGVEKAQDLALIFLLDLFLSLVRLPAIQDPNQVNHLANAARALEQERKKGKRREDSQNWSWPYRRKSFSMWASSSLICADLPTSPQNAVSNLAPGIFLPSELGDVSAAPPEWILSLSSS